MLKEFVNDLFDPNQGEDFRKLIAPWILMWLEKCFSTLIDEGIISSAKKISEIDPLDFNLRIFIAVRVINNGEHCDLITFHLGSDCTEDLACFNSISSIEFALGVEDEDSEAGDIYISHVEVHPTHIDNGNIVIDKVLLNKE